MTFTHLRVALYFIAPLLGMIPGVTVDMEARTALFDLDSLLLGLSGAAAVASGVYGIWGKK